MKRLRDSLSLHLCGVGISLLTTTLPFAAQQSVLQLPTTTEFYVTATDRDGSAGSLSASDLSVTLDKKLVQISAVKPAKDEPLVFALLIDVSGSDADNATAIKESALRLFQGLSINGNQGYLVLFNHLVAMSPAPVTYAHAQENLTAAKFIGRTALYDAIEQTITQRLTDAPNSGIQRRVIVLISDGEDNASRLSYSQVAKIAERQGVAIFSLLVPTRPIRQTGPALSRAVNLQEICRDTGGRSVLAEKVNSIDLLLSAVEAQWKIKLVSVHPSNQTMHALQVKSVSKDVEISAPAQVSLR